MKVPKLKRGASFIVDLELTPDEWATVYPWSAVRCEVVQGSRRTTVAVSADPATFTIMLRCAPSETSRFVTQPGGAVPATYDVLITKDGKEYRLPASSNLPFTVIEGATARVTGQ